MNKVVLRRKPAAGPATRKNERGAVLILALGILIVMTLMATSFISYVTLNRDAAHNFAIANGGGCKCSKAKEP
jgi:hypothetical protein